MDLFLKARLQGTCVSDSLASEFSFYKFSLGSPERDTKTGLITAKCQVTAQEPLCVSVIQQHDNKFGAQSTMVTCSDVCFIEKTAEKDLSDQFQSKDIRDTSLPSRSSENTMPVTESESSTQYQDPSSVAIFSGGCIAQSKAAGNLRT